MKFLVAAEYKLQHTPLGVSNPPRPILNIWSRSKAEAVGLPPESG